MEDLLTLMSNQGFSPRRCSSADGGEYSSACPVCGDGGKGKDSDRFHIWPAKETGGKIPGRYWCRQCGESGDPISFLQKVSGLSFKEACVELGVPLQGSTNYRPKRYQPPPAAPTGPAEWQPREYPTPSAVWREKAGNLLEDCRKRLAAEPEAISWLEKRGITRQLVDTYGLGYNQSSRGGDRYRPRSAWGLPPKQQDGNEKKLWIPRGWVIPSFDHTGSLIQLRVRRLDEDIARFAQGIKYLPIDGSSMATMVLHPEAEVFVVVESGFDAILLTGAMHSKIGAVCTWNDAARPDVRTHALLSRATCILNGLDFDKSGESKKPWWDATYKHSRRLPQPGEKIKDPGDAYAAGVDLRSWIVDALPKGLRIKLGFAKRPQISPRPATSEKALAAQVAAPENDTRVVEVELTDGLIVYVTNDRNRWQELTDQGNPVFSQNELQRLKVATGGMGEEERIAAVRKAIEVKQIFGGYIRHGKGS